MRSIRCGWDTMGRRRWLSACLLAYFALRPTNVGRKPASQVAGWLAHGSRMSSFALATNITNKYCTNTRQYRPHLFLLSSYDNVNNMQCWQPVARIGIHKTAPKRVCAGLKQAFFPKTDDKISPIKWIYSRSRPHIASQRLSLERARAADKFRMYTIMCVVSHERQAYGQRFRHLSPLCFCISQVKFI